MMELKCQLGRRRLEEVVSVLGILGMRERAMVSIAVMAMSLCDCDCGFVVVFPRLLSLQGSRVFFLSFGCVLLLEGFRAGHRMVGF